VCDPEGNAAKYRLNGLLSLVLIDCVFIYGEYHGLVELGWLCNNFYTVVVACNIIGLICSGLLLFRGLRRSDDTQEPQDRCSTVDKPAAKVKPSAKLVERFKQRSLLAHFFLGVEFNPRITLLGVEVDIKMYLYVIGAQLLHLFIIDAALLRFSVLQTDGLQVFSSLVSGRMLPTGTVAVTTYLLLFTHFLLEYLFFENVHLYTYDLFAEKVAFKLCWGCMVFYPCFYCIGVWPLVFPPAETEQGDISTGAALSIAAVYFCGSFLTRGANMQKYSLKRDPKIKASLPLALSLLVAAFNTHSLFALCCAFISPCFCRLSSSVSSSSGLYRGQEADCSAQAGGGYRGTSTIVARSCKH
jgi:delta14-sterol reductase